MGAEVRTTLRVGGQNVAGTAHLETGELRFRGETRLRIPLASVSAVDVRDGELHLTHTGGLAVLGLGDAVATKWGRRGEGRRARVHQGCSLLRHRYGGEARHSGRVALMRIRRVAGAIRSP